MESQCTVLDPQSDTPGCVGLLRAGPAVDLLVSHTFSTPA